MFVNRRPVLVVLLSAVALLFFGGVSQAAPTRVSASDYCSEVFKDRNEAAGYDHQICLSQAEEGQLKVQVRGDCLWSYGGWFWGKPPSKCRTAEARYTMTAPDSARSNEDMSTREALDGRVDATGKSFKCSAGKYKVELYYKIEMMGLSGKWSRQLEHQRAVELQVSC